MSQGPAEAADLGALADLAPELASTFVSLASDIALVIGPDGRVRNVAQGQAPLARHAEQWVGQPFADTVTQDTRGKILQLLQEVDSAGVSRRREVNLPGAEGRDIPVAFAAIRLGRHGPVLAVGRDLRAIAAIQQRFVEAQQELERDYWKQRQAESRYRQLFQVATDAVMVVDAATLAIVEANAAAVALLGDGSLPLPGQPATAGIEPASRPAVDELLLTARSTGKPAEIHARLRGGPAGEAPVLVDVSATPFRIAGESGAHIQLLVRVRRSEARGGESLRRLADYVEHTPDAVAITDSSGRLLSANAAFLLLCPTGTTEPQIRGRALAELLGDAAHRIDAVLAQVRHQGIVPQQVLALGHDFGGAPFDVELSAALLDEGDQECIGFTLRRHHARSEGVLPPVDDLASAIERLTDQLGRVSLPELMQETLHLAERHLIRSALARTQGDARLAADCLGIAPESLALRLQRHGIVALPGNGMPPPLLN